jgi:hypothetical protein
VFAGFPLNFQHGSCYWQILGTVSDKAEVDSSNLSAPIGRKPINTTLCGDFWFLILVIVIAG